MILSQSPEASSSIVFDSSGAHPWKNQFLDHQDVSATVGVLRARRRAWYKYAYNGVSGNSPHTVPKPRDMRPL
jgi:hypothetical protein